MENIKKIAGINLLILLIYIVLINVSSTGHDAGIAILILSAFAIGVQVALNLLISIVLFFKEHHNAKSFLLSALIVLVIGFSSCLGSSMI